MMFKKKLWLLGIVCGLMILSGLTGCTTTTRTTTTTMTPTTISGTMSLTPNTNADVSKVTSTSITIFTTTSSIPPSIVTTLAISSQYTPSEAITALLQESEVSFGKHIPIPTYLPQGYEINDVQVYQQSESEQKEADLIITKLNAPDITLSLVWDADGMFRILPTSEQYKFVNMSGSPGTYGQSAFLNYFSDHNTLWWDWTPVALSSQQLGTDSFSYYELVLSASTGVSTDELVLIAKSMQ